MKPFYLLDLYSSMDAMIKGAAVLYDLLAERTPEQSISHKKMPTFGEHVEFIRSKPYQNWWLIVAENPVDDISYEELFVGAVYVTKKREIGISIFNAFKQQGYGKAAVLRVMELYPSGNFYANVNPANAASKALFESIGGKVIQETYVL